MKKSLVTLASLVLAAASFQPASASFHFMQIEQVIGGVDGNTAVQAVQLRMRSPGQGQVQFSRMYAWDANGSNPILLIDFTSSVGNTASGSRILAATSNFSSFTNPPLAPNFILTNSIPASYLPAGSLTFEDDGGTIYWRLSWGGASYLGSGTGSVTNDPDGDYNPPFPGPLPSGSGTALAFKFAASASSTNNANDYQLTTGPATFVRNDGSSAVIQSTVGVGEQPVSLSFSAPFPNPVRGSMTYGVTLPRETRVRIDVLDLTGRRVARLLDADVPAGRNAFSWDARSGSLKSGVYLLTMEAEGARQARRFVFVRDAGASGPYYGPHPED